MTRFTRQGVKGAASAYSVGQNVTCASDGRRDSPTLAFSFAKSHWRICSSRAVDSKMPTIGTLRELEGHTPPTGRFLAPTSSSDDDPHPLDAWDPFQFNSMTEWLVHIMGIMGIDLLPQIPGLGGTCKIDPSASNVFEEIPSKFHPFVCSTTSTPAECNATGNAFFPLFPLGQCIPCLFAITGKYTLEGGPATDPTNAPAGLTCRNGAIAPCPAGYVCQNDFDNNRIHEIRCQGEELCLPGFDKPRTCPPFIECIDGVITGVSMWAYTTLAIFSIVLIMLWIILLRRNHRMLHRMEQHRNLFSDEGRRLGQDFDKATMPVELRFEDVGLQLNNSSKAVVLQGITGSFPAGSLVALMGPSGGGKVCFDGACPADARYVAPAHFSARAHSALPVHGTDDLYECAPRLRSVRHRHGHRPCQWHPRRPRCAP